jgi:hypothetical protein
MQFCIDEKIKYALYIDLIMTDTRKKSQKGDYELEQHGNTQYSGYLESRDYSTPAATYFAGNGLLSGRVASVGLANNACDIESMLRGIGTCNMVSHQTAPTPDIRTLKSLNLFKSEDTLMPDPLIVAKGQRPQFR